jgi:hypothetical protein
MLKQSLVSPAQPRRAETRLFPCSVLASIRPSTGTRPPHHSAARTDLVLLIRRTVRPRGYASTLHSLWPCRTACLSIPREGAPVVPHVGAIEVLLCQNHFSVVCKVWNCCYRSFASVASNVFILLKVFSSPASPSHHLGRPARHDGRVYARTSQRGTDWNPQWTGLSL